MAKGEGLDGATANKSIGFSLDNDKSQSVTKSGINTQNITITDEQKQQDLTGKTAEQMKSDILTDTTTDTARENSGALQNVFDKDQVQSEINVQMDVTQAFDANRQEAGLTAENIGNAIKVTAEIIGGTIDAESFSKQYEKIKQSMTADEQSALNDVIKEFGSSANAENNFVPVVLAEGVAVAGSTCARVPACASAVINLFGMATAEIILNSGEEKKQEAKPQPLPSTSGNSAIGMPPNGDDDRNSNDIGKQSKKMNDKQIAELIGNPKWHQTNLKSKIINAYRKELKGSKNFDFYKDPKTGNIYIKGNQSKEMIKINIERFL